VKFNFTRGSSAARGSSASGAGPTTDTVGPVMSSAVNDIPGFVSASMLRSKHSR
jgi:hypothetical protein